MTQKRLCILHTEPYFGAANQSRTDDLILTKDVLYQLSHSSASASGCPRTRDSIAKDYLFVNSFFDFFAIFY